MWGKGALSSSSQGIVPAEEDLGGAREAAEFDGSNGGVKIIPTTRLLAPTPRSQAKLSGGVVKL